MPPSSSIAAKTPAHWPLLAGTLAAGSFIGMDAAVKTLAPHYDALQLAFLRFVAGSAFALVLWAWRRTPLPGRGEWRLHALRTALLMLSLVSYFHALTLLPLVQAVALGYIAPILTPLLAMLVLGERPSRWVWAALALGIAGVGVALWPELRASSGGPARLEGLAAVAVAALAYSGYSVVARKQAQVDSLWTILLVQNVLPALLLAAPVAAFWRPWHGGDLATVVLIGACATVGLLAVTWAFSHLEASRVAPLEYTGFVWAALLGYTLFGEVPSADTALSAALIVGGCLLLLKR